VVRTPALIPTATATTVASAASAGRGYSMVLHLQAMKHPELMLRAQGHNAASARWRQSTST
jgi:hypothetical protein